ncbi:MAG: hypothetical protein QNK20_01745 [Aureibaculum sp.]|nr:hypothetical protein [Aureibaculum sp.]
MNNLGHIKESTEDENKFLQFVVNCLGISDQRKYFSISPFGISFNAPEDTRALTTDSRNADENFVIGVLNSIKPDDLNKGESAIFSTSEDGSTLKSFVKLRNDGTMELNGNADNLVGFNDLKIGFDKLTEDFNGLVSDYTSHIHTTTATVGASPTPGIITPTTSAGTPSTASIDDAKKENLKCE